MKKYQKQLLSLLAGGVLGYLVYYFFLINTLSLFFTTGLLSIVSSALFLLLSIVDCAAIIYLFWKNGSVGGCWCC